MSARITEARETAWLCSDFFISRNEGNVLLDSRDFVKSEMIIIIAIIPEHNKTERVIKLSQSGQKSLGQFSNSEIPKTTQIGSPIHSANSAARDDVLFHINPIKNTAVNGGAIHEIKWAIVSNMPLGNLPIIGDQIMAIIIATIVVILPMRRRAF